MKKVTVYTDGACRGNPGAGGYGAVLLYGSFVKELSGGEERTTNNRMELSAAIAALSALKEPCDVTLYSDSKYLVDAVNKGWLAAWEKENFRAGKKNEVLNPDLWRTFSALLSRHRVPLIWVKGHAGNPYNERCDALATSFSDSFSRSCPFFDQYQPLGSSLCKLPVSRAFWLWRFA
ncbi:MAG: ribonuclease HI [Clostridia bacterium]|nr:ribonuclease HI [Clostridia bacterium]